MKKDIVSQFEVWAQFNVSPKSILDIHKFFRDEYKIDPVFLIPNLHLTIYHSRRPMPGLEELKKSCLLSIDTFDTRFMVLAPGGENPRSNLIPSEKKVGIRIKRNSEFRSKINQYRMSILTHETPRVLGIRKPSSKSRNAFGARNFQPHISILRSGSGIINDLTKVGENFRDSIPELYFDKFIIQKRKNY